jgi:hypothetical protein
MPGAEGFVYARGELSVDQLQAEIAKFWQALDNPDGSIPDRSVLDQELNKVGLNRTTLADVDRENAIIVQAGTSGVDPATAVLLVTLAPSTNLIIKDLWATVLLPRIRRRWGEDAIGEEKRGQD